LPSQGPAEPTAFQSFAEGRVLGFAEKAFALNYQFTHRPLEIVAPSPDPAGRIVPILQASHRVELRAAAGLGRGIDATAALPIAISQSGAGSEAVSSQRPQAVEHAGVSDLRLSLRTALPRLVRDLDSSLRLEITLPTGSSRAYLGDRYLSDTLAANIGYSLGDFRFVGDFGFRNRKPQRFADVIVGTQLLVGVGVAYRAVREELLTIAVEMRAEPFLLPSPTPDKNTYPYPASNVSLAMPAEWLVNISTRPGKHPLWFSTGAGTAVALSRRSAEDSHVDRSFVAPTSPRIRVALSAMYRF
jgi:hypothetical protein